MKKTVNAKKAEPKLLNKKVLMGRKVSTVLGKEVQFKSLTTGRMKRGVIAMIGDGALAITDRKGLRCYASWKEAYEL